MNAKLKGLGGPQVFSEQVLNLLRNLCRVGVSNIASNGSCVRALALALVFFYPSEKALALEPIEVASNSVNLGNVWRFTERRRVFQFAQEIVSYGDDRFVALPSLVSTDSQPVSEQQPKAESKPTKEGGGNWVHWWIMPVIWFFLGVWLGGGFGEIRNSKNKELRNDR